ncbi:MAG: GlsB/YeaQ/YmgE family stress response membrane protein [Clostridia bacterium]|nr:GlsB/YeaQ/YmgE family stress response membrane protein [Clostridia bacterium]
MFYTIVKIALWALTGLIATRLMKSSLGLIWNIVLGIAGGAVGSFVAGLFGIHNSNTLGQLIISVGGACLVIWLARLIIPKLKK